MASGNIRLVRSSKQAPFSAKRRPGAGMVIPFLLVLLLDRVTVLYPRTGYERLEITVPETTEPVVIQTKDIRVASGWTVPATDPKAAGIREWKHAGRIQSAKTLAGIPGRCVTDTFAAKTAAVVRDVWISDENAFVAVRQKFLNRGPASVRLSALVPLSCDGPDGFVLSKDSRPGDWDVLVQERHKNGLPRTVRLSGAAEIEIDPFCLFRPGTGAGQPLLFVGYVSQTGHCARLLLRSRPAGGETRLERFWAECEFDGVLVPPGGERTGQWVIVASGTDANGMVSDYADRVAEYHGVPMPPRTAPSVFCTWYFHSTHYDETYFQDDLDALRKERMPFDVFLIDECWDLNRWGDFEAVETWPRGMKWAADRIRALGYTPGIWTCPYLVDSGTRLARQHPEWLLRDSRGQRIIFKMNNADHWVLDPTFPGVCGYLEENYRRIRRDWGYDYFKFDFMRAVFLETNQKFYDPAATRLEAYRMGLEAIRRGTGPDAYLSVCGGHYGGSIGIANSQRSGSDVVSIWRPKEIPKFRQNVLRTWMGRLWHVDPDAMMVRRREEMMHGSELTLGKLTDAEANTFALNPYIGGGLVCFSENLAELDAGRKSLYRHVIPSVNSPSIPLDPFDPQCPTRMLTRVNPRCRDLDSWATVSVVNWSDEARDVSVVLDDAVLESMRGNKFLVSEFFEQRVMGIYSPGDRIRIDRLAPHASQLLRITPWNGKEPVLAGTDLHFSGGGVEIGKWQADAAGITGEIETPWNYPVQITAAFPSGDSAGFLASGITVQTGQKRFRIGRPVNSDR